MSIQPIQSTSPVVAASPVGSATTPASAPAPVSAPGAPAPDGDGPVISALKSSLETQGFSAANAPGGTSGYDSARHNFTHALFAAIHAQKQQDRADGTGGSNASQGIDMQSALQQIAAEASSGNAPAGLQQAFDALQQTQASGSSAGSASLTQVLSGMASTAPSFPPAAGSVVDTTA